MTEHTKLKECPFCGDSTWFSGYVVQCDSCGAALAKSVRTEAIAAWNTRIPGKRLVGALRTIAKGEGVFGAVTHEYKQLARAILNEIDGEG